jgi:hypothetical protein
MASCGGDFIFTNRNTGISWVQCSPCDISIARSPELIATGAPEQPARARTVIDITAVRIARVFFILFSLIFIQRFTAFIMRETAVLQRVSALVR